ncbi:MAG: OmpA family protein [Microthrixaceae bacterium]
MARQDGHTTTSRPSPAAARNDRGSTSRWAVLGVGLVALLGLIGVTAIATGGDDGSDLVTRSESALEKAGITGATVKDQDGTIVVSNVDADDSNRIPDVLAGVDGVGDIEVDKLSDEQSTGPATSAAGEGAEADEATETTADNDAATDTTAKAGADDDGKKEFPTDKFMESPKPPADVPDVPLPKGVERMGVFRGGKIYLVGKVPSYEDGNRRLNASQEILGEPNVYNMYELDPDSSPSDDGVIIVAEPFIFPANSATLPESFFGLADLGVAIMDRFENTEMTITGHTDTSGDPATNQQLSEDRAQAFKAYLVDKGVDGARVKTEGKGSSDPAFPNDTAADRAKNRRIEVSLKGLLLGE